MLAGEYDVVSGGPALLVAVNRRASARLAKTPQPSSHFLQALHRLLVARDGAQSASARAASRVVVDTETFSEGEHKLGLGSSAAALVSATALCMAADQQELDPASVLALASQAHGDAQASLGARGSGADVATCVLGGCIEFEMGKEPRAHQLPVGLSLVFPWTGRSASTARLLAAVTVFADANPSGHARALLRIREACSSLRVASDPAQAIAAIAAAGEAVAALGQDAGVELYLPIHAELCKRAQDHGGSLKPTGAGGGDLALAAFATSEQAQAFRIELLSTGIICPDLALDNQGVRLHS